MRDFTSDKTHLSEAIHKKYSNNNLLDILRSVAKGINAQILTESTHNFDPFGDSSALLIQANVDWQILEHFILKKAI